jgi:hypothetical protein
MNWYTLTGKDLAQAITKRVDTISENQSYMQDRNSMYMCMYGNTHDFGFGSVAFDSTEMVQGLTLNVVQIMIDTLASRVGSNEPRPYFLTDEGNHKQQEQAKKLNKFVHGQFHKSKTYEKSMKAFLLAGVQGTGILKHYKEGQAIKSDWVVPDEIFVDQREAMYGSPKSLFQCRYVAREVLIAKYPNFKEQIEEIDYSPFDVVGDDTLSNMVKIIESWHLRSGENSTDGKHVISIKDIVLFEEEYEKDRFPFSFYRVFDNILGFYGRGIAEALAPIQMEINKTIKRISKCLHYMSVPRVYVERGAKIVEGHINNDVGSIVEYDGRPPIFGVAQSVSPELANHLENLYRKAFEVVGLSQLTAQSMKPAGLNSGKALREYNDIETERFKRIAKAWEAFHLDIADHYIDLAQEISEEHKDYAVLAIDKAGTSRIKWKDVNLSRDAYVMQSYPTSMLPKNPSGRLEYAQELLQAGFIGQEEGLALLDFPDIQAATNLKTSNYKMANKIINGFIDGKFIEPDIYHQNALMMPFIQQALVYYETMNLPEENLDLFRMWIDQALLLINPPQEQMTEMEGEVDAIAENQMAENTELVNEAEMPTEQPVI